MADRPEPDQNIVEATEEIIATPPTTAPTKMVVDGSYPIWGYVSYIEFEYSLAAGGSQNILLRTLRYYLQASYKPESSKFEITIPNLSPLTAHPAAINQWMRWDSSAESPSRSYTFDFIYQYLPNGPKVVVRKVVTLPIK